jgi:uncharacterized protein (TIGR02285 family)
MMQKWALAMALVLMLAAAQQASAQPEPRVNAITWITGEPSTGEAPPPFPEVLAAYLKDHWPQANHSLVQANAKRSWQMVLNGDQACLLSALRTPEREKSAYFSNTLLGPPQQLIVRRDKLATLPRNAAGEVELPLLLADARLRGAFVEARSYGPVNDAELAKVARNANVARYATSDFGSRIVTMLVKDRADYTIGYELTLTPDDGLALTSEPIAGASAPALAGIACPRNTWGRAVIRNVEQILGTPSGVALLRREAERWLATPETRKRYGPQLEEFYRQRAKPAAVR